MCRLMHGYGFALIWLYFCINADALLITRGRTTGVGSQCSNGPLVGTCIDIRTTKCSSTPVTGKCKGNEFIQCCLSSDSGSDVKPLSAEVKLKNNDLLKYFPYTFPYQQQGIHLVADWTLQRLRVYDGTKVVKEYLMSSGAKGISFKPNSGGSPIGKFLLTRRFGDGLPMGTIMKSYRGQGRIGKETDRSAYMTTRMIELDGLDPQNKNSKSRGIFLHGTNYESKLGHIASHGCFRVANFAAIEIHDIITPGQTHMYIAKSNAWPQEENIEYNVPQENIDK